MQKSSSQNQSSYLAGIQTDHSFIHMYRNMEQFVRLNDYHAFIYMVQTQVLMPFQM
jgi:hypothetical protein